MGPGMLTLPSLRQHLVVGKLNPLPLLGTPLRLGHTSWLVGIPPLPLVIEPPPVVHTPTSIVAVLTHTS